MPIIEPAIRPPAEADSFLLQITLGCSSNTCTFCGAYKTKPFKIKGLPEIWRDINEYARAYPETRKVFLMDGNALVLDQSKLVPILEKLNQTFPKLTRISAYANGDDILRKSQTQLAELSALKLKLFYMGLESGSQQILDICNKKTRAEDMITAVHKAWDSQIKSSVMVLLGLGGTALSEIHVRDTILVLNRMQPRLLSFLSLMLIPGTPLYAKAKQGQFCELSTQQLLQEASHIIQGLELTQTIFRCNHASNYLPLEGRFPQDKERLLNQLKQGLDGRSSLIPEFLRGL